MRRTFATVDGYLAALALDKRAALNGLRRTIHTIVPRAEECISYGLPAFRLDGKVLVWFSAATNHCSFFPGGVIKQFADELAGYDTRKGTVHFQPDQPLPATLVRTLIRARMARMGVPGSRRPRRAASARRRG